jgi:hypothetical protein
VGEASLSGAGTAAALGRVGGGGALRADDDVLPMAVSRGVGAGRPGDGTGGGAPCAVLGEQGKAAGVKTGPLFCR